MSSLALVWSLPIGGAHPRSTDPASLKATLFDACGCSTKSWMSRFLTPSLLAAQDHSNRAAHIDMLLVATKHRAIALNEGSVSHPVRSKGLRWSCCRNTRHQAIHRQGKSVLAELSVFDPLLIFRQASSGYDADKSQFLRVQSLCHTASGALLAGASFAACCT